MTAIAADDGPSDTVPDQARAALLDLYRLGLEADEPAIYAAAIEAAVQVTGSGIGYFHLVNEDQETIELGTWSVATLRQCNAVYERHYPLSAAGVWADCARQRRPLRHNDYQALQGKGGYPAGHVHLLRHLGVPVLDAGLVVLLVGVGNKARDYDEADVACVQSIADNAWALIRRRRRIAGLELSERQLHDLQSLAAISVWQWDPEDQALECDGNAYRVFAAEPPAKLTCTLENLLRFIDNRDHATVVALLQDPAPDAAFDLELRATRADGAAMTLHVRGAAYPRPQGRGLILRGILQDVTERREINRIRYHATHDTLTGLANRTHLLEQIENRRRNHRRNPDDLFAIHYLDLDRFKPVNDAYGHRVGDQVLKLVAKRLLRVTRKEDLVARLGGDELVVLQQLTNPVAAEVLAGKIIGALAAPMEIAGHRIEIGVSIGVAIALPKTETAEKLLTRADEAMYRAKADGRGRYRLA